MKNNSHSHKIIEVVTCLRGRHFYGVNGKAVHFTPGVVALIDRETLHDAVYSDHHNPCVDFWLHFYPGGHYTLIFVYHTPRHPECIVPVQLSKGELTEKLKQAGAQLYESDRARARLKHQRHLLYLLHELFEALESSNVTTKNIDNAPIIDSVKQYIEGHL